MSGNYKSNIQEHTNTNTHIKTNTTKQTRGNKTKQTSILRTHKMCGEEILAMHTNVLKHKRNQNVPSHNIYIYNQLSSFNNGHVKNTKTEHVLLPRKTHTHTEHTHTHDLNRSQTNNRAHNKI